MKYYWFLSTLGQMQPLCFSYSNGLCATNILQGWSVIHAGRQQHYRNSRLEANIKSAVWLSGQRFLSLVCFEISPEIQLLIKDWDSLLSTNHTDSCCICIICTFCHPVAEVPGYFVPFFLEDKFQVYYSTHIPTTSVLVSPWTSQFPIEMMSDLTSPGCSSIAT